MQSWDEAWTWWRPRPDNPELFDQQTGFVLSKALVAFLFGGNGAGKTACAAYKAGQFLMNTPAPRPDTPFWVLAQSYVQCCATCWAEKLWGQGFLPRAMVDFDRIVWLKPTMNWPLMVPLLPDEKGNNWVLEFRTFEQGRKAMQARSIGGAWFSEQVEWGIFLEVLRGCRDYMIPGSVFAECTPIEPEMCIQIERYLDDPPAGWEFFRANTDCNTAVSAEWRETFRAATPEEMLATRFTGALATFEGVIYQGFNPAIHVTNDDSMAWLPGTHHHRGIDWGASTEHPFACLWGCYDSVGDWLIYDEYWNTSQERITQDHATEILARSIAWGWPEPKWLRQPPHTLSAYCQTVLRDLDRLGGIPDGSRRLKQGMERNYGDTYADPARPGEIQAFNRFGIPTFPAVNAVYQGIDTVRTLLKVQPTRQRPRLRIHARCKHLIEEIRKYRWVKRRQTGLVVMAASSPTPLKKDDDTCDAGRYLLHSVECRKGLKPATSFAADTHQRTEVQLARIGNGERWRPAQVGQMGWWRK